MKKGLLGSTALIGATALMASAAGAAEAPTWKLTGNANFQFYWVDQDAGGLTWTKTKFTSSSAGIGTKFEVSALIFGENPTKDAQDHDWYFGVDEAELQLNVSGTADNGLNYGFKIEINALTTDNTVADEVRLQFSGGWGTLQMGDEDGAEDIMNYGGENLMGATGGFDGDQDDYLFRGGVVGVATKGFTTEGTTTTFATKLSVTAPSYPTVAGDTSDHTKISYFSPRFSGFQVGASITPTSGMDGDEFKADSSFENHIGVGANYDNSFGDLRIRASAVFSSASATSVGTEDISAWQVGGIVGFGPFSLGANYADNGDSGELAGSGIDSSFWDVAASFETGPFYLSAGYFASERDLGIVGLSESTYEHIALTADYTVAPGLGVYAEINLISDELLGGDVVGWTGSAGNSSFSNDTTSLVIGANVSF